MRNPKCISLPKMMFALVLSLFKARMDHSPAKLHLWMSFAVSALKVFILHHTFVTVCFGYVYNLFNVITIG